MIFSQTEAKFHNTGSGYSRVVNGVMIRITKVQNLKCQIYQYICMMTPASGSGSSPR